MLFVALSYLCFYGIIPHTQSAGKCKAVITHSAARRKLFKVFRISASEDYIVRVDGRPTINSSGKIVTVDFSE